MQKFIWLHMTTTDLETELQQLGDEGRDLSSVEAEIAALKAADFDLPETQARFRKFMDDVQSLPTNDELAAREPDDLEAIRALRPSDRVKLGPIPEDLGERLKGAWCGRAAGCLLGKPIEGYRSKLVDPILAGSGNMPMHRYLRSDDVAPGTWDAAFGENVWSGAFLVDRCHGMPEDDDMNYTVTGLAIVEKYGRDFTSGDIVTFWLENIPILHTCTAERIAYRNFVNGIAPHESATYQNPYREWIGAQIRADYFGYVNPGNPELAAEMAWRDARISHIRNGIYGEMWAAACIAAAFTTTDVRKIIAAGLGEIPAECRLADAIKEAIVWRDSGMSLREVIEVLRAKYDEDSWHVWTHTITNAVVVAIGLLWGEDDFEKTICAAVEPLYDTDCNGATAGSIFGAAHGLSSISAKWLDPLQDSLETGVKGYEKVSLTGLAEKTAKHLPA
jgi:ADP-ribosylglycohydrolase